MRINLPFCLRSPRYRANINRRLAPSKWTAPIERDVKRRAIEAAARNVIFGPTPGDMKGYRRADFTTSAPIYLPPDEAPRLDRRAWWRAPALLAVIGSLAVGAGIAILRAVL